MSTARGRRRATGQTLGAAPDHLDQTGVGAPVGGVLASHADDEVRVPVLVEVGGVQRAAELVVGLGAAGHTGLFWLNTCLVAVRSPFAESYSTAT